MARKAGEFPEEGEFIVGTVKDVKNYGAFVTLDEYPGKEGFIHISEVASGWVKYVRDHVRENAKIVCKVTSVDRSKGHVDLSLKRVNEHQQRETLQEWKNNQKAEKLLEIVAEELGQDLDTCYDDFGYDLIEEFGGLYAAFEAVAMDDELLDEAGLAGPWTEAFVQIARENITIPHVRIKGYLEVTCPTPNGVDVLRDALQAAERRDGGDGAGPVRATGADDGDAAEADGEEAVSEAGPDADVEVSVQYLGAPHYRIRVKAPDYKVAEQELRDAADRALAVVEAGGGTGKFERQREE